MPCSTVYSLASSTKSSAYFTARIAFSPILKSPNPSRISLVRYSPCKLNKIADKEHSSLNPLQIFTFLASPWSILTLALWLCTICWSVFFRTTRNQFPLGSALILSRLYGQISYASRWRKHKILRLLSKSSFWRYSEHPNCIPSSCSSSKSKLVFSKYIFNFTFNPFSKYPCYYLCCMCGAADCAMVAEFCSLWLFFFKTIIASLVKVLGLFTVSYMLLMLHVM